MSARSLHSGVAVAFAGAMLLSFDTLLLRGIDGHFLTVAFWRGLLMGLSAIVFMLLLRRREHPAFGPIRTPGGLAVAGLYGLASVFFVLSVAFTSVANMLVIIATAPLWAALASYLFLREAIAASTRVAIACGTAGAGVVVLPDLGTGHLLGDAFSLATALCMAGAFTMSRRVQEPLGLAPSLGGGMSALVLAPFVPAFGFETPGQATLMALEGAILMPVALGLIALAPRYLPAPQVGLFLLLEAVLGPLWVWLFIGETPTANAVLGGVIVVSAIVVHTFFCLRSHPAGQAYGTTVNWVSWPALCERLRSVCKALFCAALLALVLTSPARAAVDPSGTADRGELIRCPDWQRLMSPVVLASAGEGQTKHAFEERVGVPASTAKSPPSAESCTHTVVAGDTLGGIAKSKLGRSSRWREITALNPGTKPTGLRIGTVLKLPCTVADEDAEASAGATPDRAGLLSRLKVALARPRTPATGASPEPAAGARATDEADAPQDEPELPPPPTWTAAQGEFLADVLTRWGREAGWTVIVDTTDAWRLAVAFRTEAAFDSAVAELIRGMGHDGVPPRVRLYPNNVLRLGGPL